ncbi:MAG: hypothetical protein C0518_00900 [Opitutus sp.]|nr:hypothetical protein [Opitutus sp.]
MSEVVILGARSWIGFRLTEAFARARPEWRVLGTSAVAPAVFPSGVPALPTLVAARTTAEISALVRAQRPRVVINLLRGEDENDRSIHLAVARACSEAGCRYLYASSVLALDGYTLGGPLAEDLPARSVTPYGQFKGSCEAVLLEEFTRGDWQILRFASIQGWSPWKPSRNEAFLRKIVAGTPVVVDVGVRQNRLQDTVFAAAVVDVALCAECQGVFHFGADDFSDEVDFLRAVAWAFGLDGALVRPGVRREVNLSVSCERLHAVTGNRWRRLEAETLTGLRTEPGLIACLASR